MNDAALLTAGRGMSQITEDVLRLATAKIKVCLPGSCSLGLCAFLVLGVLNVLLAAITCLADFVISTRIHTHARTKVPCFVACVWEYCSPKAEPDNFPLHELQLAAAH